MARRRTRLVAITAAALVLLVALAGPAVTKRLVHPRDEAAFHDYVTTYVGGWRSSADPRGHQRDEAWVARYPDLVLAEGDRACAWLADQPAGPVIDRSGKFSVDTMVRGYLGSTEAGDVGLSEMGRRTLVVGAWAHLCWWVRRDKTAPTGLEED